MLADLTFRKVEAADLPRLQEIRTAAFTPIHNGFRAQMGAKMFHIHYRDWDEKQGAHLNEICASTDSNQQVYAALAGGELVGFVDFSLNPARKIGELGLNAVDPHRQGTGIGTAMYQFALEKLKQAGAEMVIVGTGGDAAHLPARRAYGKAGFSVGIPGIHYFMPL
jgi:GNAT superfamily N-acetyltransferase